MAKVTRTAPPEKASAGPDEPASFAAGVGDPISSLVGRMRTLFATRIQEELAAQGADISFTEWLVLRHLTVKPPMTAIELARHLLYDPGALTRLLDRLERRGYVRRARHPQDRRALLIEMTPQGKAAWTELGACADRIEAMALRGVPRPAIRTMRQALRRMLENLDGGR